MAAVALAATLALLLAALAVTSAAAATDIITGLQNSNVYISPKAGQTAHINASQTQSLRQTVGYASSHGVSEKLAIVYSYPSQYSSAAVAADQVRSSLGFSG